MDNIEGKARFETKHEFHLNLIYINCGKIDDFIALEITHHWNQILGTLEIQPLGQSVNIYYLCEKCQKTSK